MDGKPTKKQSAMLNWQQQDDEFTIRLNGPFGLGAVKLSGNKAEAVLKQSGRDPMIARNADVLLARAAGITTPLNHLRYWIKGQPAPSKSKNHLYDELGVNLLGFDQHGWRIELDRYRQFGAFDLPARIKIRSLDAQRGIGNQQLTVLVSRWAFRPSPMSLSKHPLDELSQ